MSFRRCWMRLVGDKDVPIVYTGFKESKLRFLLRLLDRFNLWFTSAAGVLQTAIVCLVLAGLDATGLDHDHSGYWLLWGLTVYSAITQPALAYAGAVSAARVSAIEEQNARILAHLETLLENRPDERR